MPSFHLKTKENVTLIGAAPVTGPLLDTVLSRAPTVVAADGGADTAHAASLVPMAIIGDLDSLTTAQYWRNSDTRIFEIPEQDTTDFDKCMRVLHAPVVLAVGFSGGRLDHELAVLSGLLAFHEKPVIVVSERDICFHCPPRLSLPMQAGQRISLFPLRPITGRISKGLRWSVKDMHLEPGGMIGTSNEATGPVKVGFDQPGALVILPGEMLDAAIAALRVGP